MRLSPSLAMLLAAQAIVVLGFTAATWNTYEPDEFVNLQQAQALHAGERLYDEVPSNHPPLFTAWLAILAGLPGPALVAARLSQVAMVWTTGALVTLAAARLGGLRSARWAALLVSASVFIQLRATRVSNETPVMLAVAIAGFLLVARPNPGRRTFVAVGALAALAVGVRLTAVWYAAPLLVLVPWRRWGWLALGAAPVAAGLTASAGWVWHVGGFWDQAVAFHSGRVEQAWSERLLLMLAGVGVALAAGAALLGVRWPKAWRPAWLASGAAATMALLPVAWIHYYLPLTPVTTGLATHAVRRVAAPGRAWRVAAIVLLHLGATTAVVVGQWSQGSYGDLHDAHDIAGIVEAATPPEAIVLANQPEFALLAHRANLDRFYWTVGQMGEAPDDPGAVHLVVKGREQAQPLPPAFADAVTDWPCRTLHGAHLWWNPAHGDEPAPLTALPACP